MKRDFFIKRRNPLCLLLHLLCPVILPRNDQRSQLHMTIPRRPGNKRLHRLQVSPNLPVILLCKPLQINIHSINKRQKLLQHPNLRRPVGHQHIVHAVLLHQPGRIPHILPAHQRLIVGKCHPCVSHSPALPGLSRQIIRRNKHRLHIPGHGNLVVLTKRTP